MTYKEKRREDYRLLREQVFNKYSGRCAYCGCCIKESFQVDHLIPKRRGANSIYHSNYGKPKGGDDITNLMPACASCNACKSDLDLEDFRERVEQRIKMLRNFSEYRIAVRFGLIKEELSSVIFHFEKQSLP